tara:strand:+ start:248 stop:376 length:129 start_codon:yes stop_codon:yes gene_type:complete
LLVVALEEMHVVQQLVVTVVAEPEVIELLVMGLLLYKDHYKI